MRQFDYTTVPAELEATPITNLLLSIREHKGRQLALSQVKPELLSSLMEEAKIQSTRSSNGLEGIVTTQKRLKAIMAYSAKPSSRAEEEIAGRHRSFCSCIVTSWRTRQSRMEAIGKIAITKSSPLTIKEIDLCALGPLRP
ncbi:MAG: hypothetical protein BHV61_01630 [Collinsella sp. 60_9]|nr:MAG: hypothetical protein BHV61_01630 [Collinsella sp. 60_9]